ncbi:MAG: ERCC4 domain-containing protein [Gemmatimonadales bacterium]
MIASSMGDNGPGLWIVERTRSLRFPFRISVEQGGRLILALRAQSAWPGPGQQIFCLREDGHDPAEPLEALERVPLAQLSRVGRKLTVVLDRPTRKRCEILTVEKPRRDGTGTYQQIFLRTESGIRSHRSRSRVELAGPAPGLTIVVDSAERYPWRFPEARVVRRRLPTGDYALEVDGRLAALVERKSFDNLLTEVGSVQALHHQLADLAGHPPAALVIEAQYGDFLDERRLAGRWGPSHLARVLAELTALHPTLPIVYAGSRKLANLWTARFFAACARREGSPQLELVRETLAAYDPVPRSPGLDEAIRVAVLTRLGQEFAFADLRGLLPEADDGRLRRVLAQLKAEGRVRRVGAGRAARWVV